MFAKSPPSDSQNQLQEVRPRNALREIRPPITNLRRVFVPFSKELRLRNTSSMILYIKRLKLREQVFFHRFPNMQKKNFIV